jgi:hypothetical protein
VDTIDSTWWLVDALLMPVYRIVLVWHPGALWYSLPKVSSLCEVYKNVDMLCGAATNTTFMFHLNFVYDKLENRCVTLLLPTRSWFESIHLPADQEGKVQVKENEVTYEVF